MDVAELTYFVSWSIKTVNHSDSVGSTVEENSSVFSLI